MVAGPSPQAISHSAQGSEPTQHKRAVLNSRHISGWKAAAARWLHRKELYCRPATSQRFEPQHDGYLIADLDRIAAAGHDFPNGVEPRLLGERAVRQAPAPVEGIDPAHSARERAHKYLPGTQNGMRNFLNP
jgi:hypothetical protein